MKAYVDELIRLLEAEYPDALCSLQYAVDWQLLFAVRLSAQCTDERVNQVAPGLYARYPTLEAMAEAKPEDVEHDTCRLADRPYDEEQSYTVSLDGFIVSDNITVNYYHHMDWGYELSDHDPVIMQFKME